MQGGTLKPWPELVEGLFGGGLAGKACLFCKFLVSFVLQRPINLLPSVRIKKADPCLSLTGAGLFSLMIYTNHFLTLNSSIRLIRPFWNSSPWQRRAKPSAVFSYLKSLPLNKSPGRPSGKASGSLPLLAFII